MSSLMTHQCQLLGIAKTWAEKNLAGWSDECHRDLLMRHGAKRIGGRISALTMSATQINAAISDYAARGWPRRENYRPKMGAATGEEKKVPPAIAHVVRLWGRLGQAGKLNNASRMALLNFCDRQVGRVVMDLDSLTPGECTSVIEALKSWLARGA